MLESGFPLIWIEGELSNLSTPRSGHMYFSLKDTHAQTRCAMFRMKRQLLRFTPEAGDKVLARARITLYEARGDFQLIIEHMEPAGEGQLRQAIEQLKQRLDQEGLFDPRHKKDLPAIPATVGVITSPSGAAITDILNVFKRRFPALQIIIYPASVQGSNAVAEMIEMLELADKRNECDLLILARGGGSLEDLMAFNDEALARTIFNLRTPVISAVGHEIDTSISDYVADRRAPTPSAAAELASPDIEHLAADIDQAFARIRQALGRQLQNHAQHLKNLQHRLSLISPQRQLQDNAQKLDDLSMRQHRLMTQQLLSAQRQFDQLRRRLQINSPEKKLQLQKQQLSNLSLRLQNNNPSNLLKSCAQQLALYQRALQRNLRITLEKNSNRLNYLGNRLDSVSPLATLSRGYSITRNADGEILRTTAAVKSGDQITTRLQHGEITATVNTVKADKN